MIKFTQEEQEALSLQSFEGIQTYNIVLAVRTKKGLFIVLPDKDKTNAYGVYYRPYKSAAVPGGYGCFIFMGDIFKDFKKDVYSFQAFYPNRYGQYRSYRWSGDPVYNKDFVAFIYATAYKLDPEFEQSFPVNPFEF